MEESKVRGQIKDALDPTAGLEEPGPRGENRRPEFLIRPEEVLLYRKRAGESTDHKVPNSIWNHLPPDFRDAALLTPLESGSQGLVLLTRNSLLAKTSSGFNLDSVPVTYETNVSRLPNDSEMNRILNGTWVRVRGPRGNGNGNGSVFFKPVKVEPIRGEGSGGRLRITFSHGSRRLARAMLEKRAMDASGPMRAAFGSIELNGMPPGGYRRARWKELLALADLYGIEALSAGRRTPRQEIAVQEEAVDQELILGLLENEQYLRNVFEAIFSWPDLAQRSVEGQDIVHVWEGGFKRVYRVALSLQGEPAPFSFYVKIVKPDVVRSDSDYLYDASYVNRMAEIADQARRKFLFLHPPSAPNQFLSDRMGRSRIVFSEGAISPTNARWASSEARRLAIETYMKLYLVFDGKVFLEDPKPANTVLHRLSRQRYEGTIVDLDNLLEVGHGLHRSSVVFHLLDYGFRTDEIVPAMENILGTHRTLGLLNAARWIDRNLGIRRSDFQDRYPDSRQWLQQSITAGQARPPLPIPASIRIMLNGREQIVPEGVTLADLLSDRYVNIQSIAVRVNESPLLEEAGHSLNLVKRWALYDQTPAREGWSITWAPVKKPVPKPEEKPGEERIHVKDREAKMQDLRQTGFDRELKELRDVLARFRQDLSGRRVAENEYFRAAHHALGRLIHGMDRYLKQPLIYPLNRRRIEAAEWTFDRVDFKNEDERRQKRRQLTELINTGIALDGRFREAMNSDSAPAAGLEERSIQVQNWNEEESADWGRALAEALRQIQDSPRGAGGVVDDYQLEENFWKLTYGDQEERLEKWRERQGNDFYFVRNGPLFFVDFQIHERQPWLGFLKDPMGSHLVWVTSLLESSLGDPQRNLEGHTHATLAALRRSDLKGKLIVEAGAGDGILALEALILGKASFVVLIDNDPVALQRAQANLQLNGFLPDRDFHILQGDLREGSSIESELKKLGRQEKETALVSDIGTWTEIYGDTSNATSIRLIPHIERATGTQVTLFIGAGYRQLSPDPISSAPSDPLLLDQAFIQNDPYRFHVDPRPVRFSVSLGGGDRIISAVAWMATRPAAGLEEPTAVIKVSLLPDRVYDEAWLQAQERDLMVPHLRAQLQAHFRKHPAEGPQVIWDIGAFTGEVAKQLPGDRIVAFERNRRTFQTLRENLQGARFVPVEQDFRDYMPQAQEQPTAVVASHVLYYFHRKEREAILDNILTVLPPGRPLLIVLNSDQAEPGTRVHLRQMLMKAAGKRGGPLSPREVEEYFSTRGVESMETKTLTLEFQGDLQTVSRVAQLFLPSEARNPAQVERYLQDFSQQKRGGGPYRFRAEQILLMVVKQDPSQALRFPPLLKNFLGRLTESEREQIFRVITDKEISSEQVRLERFLAILERSKAYVRLDPEDQRGLVEEITGSESRFGFSDLAAVENLLKVEVGRAPIGGYVTPDVPLEEMGGQTLARILLAALRLLPLSDLSVQTNLGRLFDKVYLEGTDFISEEMFMEGRRQLSELFGADRYARTIPLQSLRKTFPDFDEFLLQANLPVSLQNRVTTQASLRVSEVSWLLELFDEWGKKRLPASLAGYRRILEEDPRALRVIPHLPPLDEAGALWTPVQVRILSRYERFGRRVILAQSGSFEARFPEWLPDAGNRKGAADFPPPLQKKLAPLTTFTERVFAIAEFLGWSDPLLAQMAHVNLQRVSAWRHQGTAEPQPSSVPHFAAALDAHPIFLLTGSPSSEALRSGPPGKRAALLMRADGMSQEEVGQLLGITQAGVSRALKSRRWDRKNLFDWSEILEVEPAVLEFGQEPPAPPRLSSGGTYGFTRKADAATVEYADRLHARLVQKMGEIAGASVMSGWRQRIDPDPESGYHGLTRKLTEAYPDTLKRMGDYGFHKNISEKIQARAELSRTDVAQLANHLIRTYQELETLFASAPEYHPATAGGYGNKSQHVFDSWHLVARGISARRFLTIVNRVRLPVGVLKSKVLVSPDPETEISERENLRAALLDRYSKVQDHFGHPIFSPQTIQNYAWVSGDPVRELGAAREHYDQLIDFAGRGWIRPVRPAGPGKGRLIEGRVFAKQSISKPFRAGAILKQLDNRVAALTAALSDDAEGENLQSLSERVEEAGLNAYRNGGGTEDRFPQALDLLNRAAAYRQVEDPAFLVGPNLQQQAASLVKTAASVLEAAAQGGQSPQDARELETMIREIARRAPASTTSGLEESPWVLLRVNGMQRVLEYLAGELNAQKEESQTQIVRDLFARDEEDLLTDMLSVLGIDIEDVLEYLLEDEARSAAGSVAVLRAAAEWGAALFSVLGERYRLGESVEDLGNIFEETNRQFEERRLSQGRSWMEISPEAGVERIEKARAIVERNPPAAGLEEGRIPGQQSANDDPEVIERAIGRLQAMRDFFIATPPVIRVLRKFLGGHLSIDRALEEIAREDLRDSAQSPIPAGTRLRHRLTLKIIWLMVEFDLTPQGALIAYSIASRPREQVISKLIRQERLHRSRINRSIAGKAVQHAAELNPLFDANPAAGLEESGAASVEVAEGMARMNDFLGQVGSDLSVFFDAGVHDLTQSSFGESKAIQEFKDEGIRPLLVVLPGRLSLPGASLDSPVLKLLVDPKYDRALREQLSFALVSGIVEITVDPSAARFVVGDRDFVRNQKENRLVSREATFLQVDPSTISSLTRDFLTLVAAYRPGAVLVVGTQTEHADAVVLFESA